MRNRKANRAFQPSAEGVEERVLTTVGMTAGGVHETIAGRGQILAERHAALLANRTAALVNREGLRSLDLPPIGPGLGKGLVRITLPYSHTDYGVISIWNNTPNRVTLLVGASTHQNGAPQAFTLLPGRTQSYYAYSTINGDPPVFQVQLPGASGPYTVTNVNVVFQSVGYFAPAKAGYPYAINIGVNGYYLSYI